MPDIETNQPWPRYSIEEATRILCAPGGLFEMETVSVEGIATRCWKNTPPTLREAAQHIAREYGERLFLIHENERITYDEWFRAVVAAAHAMRTSGIEQGDRVAIAMRNLPEWPIAFFAAVSIGAIAVPLNAWWTGAELQHGLSHSGSKMVVCDPERLERIAPRLGDLPEIEHILVVRSDTAPGHGALAFEGIVGRRDGYSSLPAKPLPEAQIEPDSPATIFYTSGTTGKPKGAVGSHRNMLTSWLSSNFAYQRAAVRRSGAQAAPETNIRLVSVPFFHVATCNATLMAAIATGDTLILTHKWDAQQAFEIIERERVTHAGGVPALAWQMLDHPARTRFDLSSLRSVAYGGAPAAPELARRISAELNASAGNGWGMTETSSTVIAHSAEDYLNRPESCGFSLPVSDIAIRSIDGLETADPGETGELWVKGPQVVHGYWQDPQATAETFVDGWVRTGDVASIDEQGYCTVLGRLKDVVIRGGENIYPAELEGTLLEHPGISDAAVVGVPHQTLGEECAALIAASPGSSLCDAGLREWLSTRLAAFKIPRHFLFADKPLPRNAAGKLLKASIRSEILGRLENPGGTPSS